MSIVDYLKLPDGAKKKKKKLGRGQGSGHGKTSTHGHKGQQARGNTKRNKGFEGGQMPLARRLPKRGFTNRFKKIYQIVNIGALAKMREGDVVTPQLLKNKGLIKSEKVLTKVLGNGKLSKKLEVHAHAFSKIAKEAITASGGKAVIIKGRKPEDQKLKKQQAKKEEAEA